MKKIVADKYDILFLVILVIAILSRIILLDKYPLGLHEDEAGMMYDAYSLAEYGTDRYLNENPVYLVNFGGGQSIMYAGITSVLFKLFGVSTLIARIPSAFFSILAIILAFVLSKKYIGKKYAVILAFLITICPWHIMQARWGLDCNLLSSFIMISVFTFLNAKKDWHYIISGMFWGLTLYTYALSYIMLPIFFLCLCGYLLYVKKITLKQIIITIIPIFVLAIPLILLQTVNITGKGTIKFGPFTIPMLYNYRASEIGFKNIINNFTTKNNIFKLLFVADHNLFNSLPEFGTIYYFMIPFVLGGLIINIKETVISLKHKQFSLRTVFLIQFVTIFICLLVVSDLQLYKLNPLFIMLLTFGADCILWIYNKKKILGNIIIGVLILSFIAFLIFYFRNINQKVGISFNSDVIPLVEYLEEQYPNKEIVLKTDAIQTYIYVLLGSKMSPYDFYNSAKIYRVGRDLAVSRAGRYLFSDSNVERDKIYVIEETDNIGTGKLLEQLEQAGFKRNIYNNFLIYSN